MTRATYDGFNIFGRYVTPTIVTVLNPPAEQINAFFGVSGIQTQYGGTRGRVFEIIGVLDGDDGVSLNAAERVFESYIDGKPRTFVDEFGNTWPNVKVLQFQRQGRVRNGGWVFVRPYRALLRSPA